MVLQVWIKVKSFWIFFFLGEIHEELYSELKSESCKPLSIAKIIRLLSLWRGLSTNIFGKFVPCLLIALLINSNSVNAQKPKTQTQLFKGEFRGINTHETISQLPLLEVNSEFKCGEPILSDLQTHIVKEGETIETIADIYALTVTTIISVNPPLENNALTVGQKLAIPPFNGIRVQVPTGVQWRDIAEAYGVRQDVLFELNGCVKNPELIFIPGVNWQEIARQDKNYQGFNYYPLETKPSIGLNYGWQETPQNGRFFHSGVDFLAPVGSSVFAAGDGIVVFVGNEPNYGFLVIINHGLGRQTRYAHLSRVNVKIEDEIQAGSLIGQVGLTGKPDIADSHLHFEVRIQTPQGWITQDPMLNLPQN